MIMNNIFGNSVSTHYTEGLVDATTESMFENLLNTMSVKWSTLDSLEDGPIHTFCRWFKRYIEG